MTSAVRPLGHRFVHGPMTYSNDDDDAPVASRPRAASVNVGNRHNRKDPTVTAIAEMLRDVQDTLAALDDRLGKLEGSQGSSTELTRQLAQNMVQIGESLSRRVKSLEHDVAAHETAALASASAVAAAPSLIELQPAAAETGVVTGPFAVRPVARRARARAPLDTWVLAAGVVALVAVVGAGLWFLQRQSAPAPLAAPSAITASVTRAPGVAPTPNSSAPAAEHATNDGRTAERPHHYSLYPVHHGYYGHRQAATTDDAAPASPPATSDTPG